MTDQHLQWEDSYQAMPHMLGPGPSSSAIAAASRFREAGVHRVVELGAGHGRDALYFASQGFRVTALDFSATGLSIIRADADAAAIGDRVETVLHDVREPLPFETGSVEAVYAHLLLCMALSTAEIRRLVSEVRRVLRPGGLFVYTVRNTDDAHFKAGQSLGDDIYENGGFAVHFFSRGLVEDLAAGWRLEDITADEEGELPRRIWRVTQTAP